MLLNEILEYFKNVKALTVLLQNEIFINHINVFSLITKHFSGIIDSINNTSHSGCFGLIPKNVDTLTGEFQLELLRRKFEPKGTLNPEEQKELEKKFFSKNKNKLLKIGR